jgi:hypothetical protein
LIKFDASRSGRGDGATVVGDVGVMIGTNVPSYMNKTIGKSMLIHLILIGLRAFNMIFFISSKREND